MKCYCQMPELRQIAHNEDASPVRQGCIVSSEDRPLLGCGLPSLRRGLAVHLFVGELVKMVYPGTAGPGADRAQHSGVIEAVSVGIR